MPKNKLVKEEKKDKEKKKNKDKKTLPGEPDRSSGFSKYFPDKWRIEIDNW